MIIPDDDPIECEGCGEEVPFSTIDSDLSWYGWFCEACAPAMRRCIRDEETQPGNSRGGYRRGI